MTQTIQEDLQLQNYRLQTIKYRIYSVILLVGIYWMYTLISTYFIEFDSINSTYDNASQNLALLDTQIASVNNDVSLVRSLSGRKEQLSAIYSTQSGCDALPQNFQPILPVLKNYLLLDSLNRDKMIIDEKKILESIDKHLLQEDGRQLGTLSVLEIGEQALDRQKNKYVKITVTLNTDYGNLVRIVNRIENVIPASEQILYKIQSMKYDVLNANQNQDIQIEMWAYFL